MNANAFTTESTENTEKRNSLVLTKPFAASAPSVDSVVNDRRVDLPQRIDFDLWLYVKRGVEGEEFRKWEFEKQSPIRAAYIKDSDWHWMRAAADRIAAGAENVTEVAR